MPFEYIPAPSPTPGTPPDKVIPSSEWLNEHTGPHLIAVSSVFMGICALFVILRFWSRQLQQSKIGWDDYLIYPALVTCWASEATCILIVPSGGVGTRAAYWEASGQAFMIGEWAKTLYVVEMLYLLAACVTKLSLLAIFIRILRDPISRKVTQVMIGITIAAYIGESAAATAQCIPFAYQYDKTIPGGHCFNLVAFYEYISIPNILTDVVLVVLPIPTVLKLQTTRSQKIQLLLAFALGGFGIVASILRFTNFFTTQPLEDPTYNSVVLLTWTVIEPAIYLISACLPSLRPLLNKTVERITGRVDAATTKKAYGSTPTQWPSAQRSRRNVSIDSTEHVQVCPIHGNSSTDTWSDHMKTESYYVPEHSGKSTIPRKGQILQTSDICVTRSKR